MIETDEWDDLPLKERQEIIRYAIRSASRPGLILAALGPVAAVAAFLLAMYFAR
ncbi:MAG: hypothetical protein PHS60_15205 [Zavarzinia sp.]|nr:hypothetical protein [Zavarzinia sp.]